MRGAAPPHVPVLIVGAGPAGLTASLLLAHLGIGSVVVERRGGVSPLPRATGVNVRTMEILRALGIADEVTAKAPDSHGLVYALEMDWLGGPVIESVPYPTAIDPAAAGAPSPAGYQFCPQDVLEPILVAAARRSGCVDLKFDTELVGFVHNVGGVSAQLQQPRTGAVRPLACDYLIGADGAASHVRRTLGIGMSGNDHLSRNLNIVFNADLSRASRRTVIHRVQHPTLGLGVFRDMDGAGGRWSLLMGALEPATPERCARAVREYARDPELRVDVVAAGEWEGAAVLADRFRVDRVFLLGDAAHRVVPIGGLGMNAAIQAAHNLAWKLAAVHNGWAGPGLLDTYEVERRHAGAQTVELSYGLFQDPNPARRASNVLGHVLGMAYPGGAFIPDGTAPPSLSNPVAEYVPTARPGHRAPHVWIESEGRRMSTLDLFGRGLAVLSASAAWTHAADRLSEARHLPLRGRLIADLAWIESYGVDRAGAVLVRPDGYVAWRTAYTDPDPETVLGRVLDHVLAPPPTARRRYQTSTMASGG